MDQVYRRQTWPVQHCGLYGHTKNASGQLVTSESASLGELVLAFCSVARDGQPQAAGRGTEPVCLEASPSRKSPTASLQASSSGYSWAAVLEPAEFTAEIK